MIRTRVILVVGGISTVTGIQSRAQQSVPTESAPSTTTSAEPVALAPPNPPPESMQTPSAGPPPAVVAPKVISPPKRDVPNAPAKDQAPGWNARVAPLLPTLRLSASTKGDTDFTGGIDVVYGYAPDWDVIFTPTFSVASSNGLAKLFSSDEKNGTNGSKSWSAGMTVSLVNIGITPNTSNDTADEDRVMVSAVGVCSKIDCKRKDLDKAEKNFCDNSTPFLDADLTKRRDWAGFEQKNLCTEGNSIWLAYDKKIRERRGAFPAHVISVGMLGGANSYKFIDATAGSGSPLSDQSTTKANYALGAVWTYVSTHGPLTFELPVNYTSKMTAQSTTAKWCVPAGNVARGTTGVTDPAETCTERPLGAPTRTADVWAAALIGGVAKPDGLWRIAIGPTFDYQVVGANQGKYIVGLEAPIYLNFVSAPTVYTGDFKGIIRLVPAFGFAHDSSGWGSQVSLVAQLLGQRTLFGRALDWP